MGFVGTTNTATTKRQPPTVSVVRIGGMGVPVIDDVGLPSVRLVTVDTDKKAAADYGLSEQQLTKISSGGWHTALRKWHFSPDYIDSDELWKEFSGSDIVFVAPDYSASTGKFYAEVVIKAAKKSGALVLLLGVQPLYDEKPVIELPRVDPELSVGLCTDSSVGSWWPRFSGAPTPYAIAAADATFLVGVAVDAGIPDDQRMFTYQGERRKAKVDPRMVSSAGVRDVLSENQAAVNRFMGDVVRTLTDSIVTPGLINIGIDDLKRQLQNVGSAVCVFSDGGTTSAVQAAQSALSSPTLAPVIGDAKKIIMIVEGRSDLGLHDLSEAARLVYDAASPNRDLIYGTIIDAKREDVRAMIIATGFKIPRPRENKDG